MSAPPPLQPVSPLMAAVAPHSRSINFKSMQTIFPQYLDAELTRKEGRRISKAHAVSSPTLDEIVSALHSLGFAELVVLERKSYPRSQGSLHYAMVPHGAVKMLLKEPVDVHYIKKSEFDHQTRAPVIPGIETKHELLKQIAAAIKAKGGERPVLPTPAAVLAAANVNLVRTKK